MFAAGAIPDVGVAVLPARDDPLAIGRDENLVDDAIAALGRQGRGRMKRFGTTSGGAPDTSRENR